MTASIHRLGSGREAGAYYTNGAQREAKPRNRDEYYARDGDGVWWSSGESVVRHGASVDLASFRDLCAGFDPRTGGALVRKAGADHWAGVDLTFTIGKSASILWAAGTAEQRTIIETAHREAVNEALRFVEREGLIEVRSGAGGKHRARPTDIIAARFDHYTTRAGDPNCHTHCVFMNVAGSGHGGTRYRHQHLTIDPLRLFQQVKGAGAAYRAAAAERLARHGFTFREAGQGQWEIVGIPEQAIATFSKRSHQIDAFVGPSATAAQREIAALVTRSSKDTVPSGDELEARWHRELAAQNLDPWRLALAPMQERAPAPGRDQEDEGRRIELDPPELPGSTPVAIAASALFRHESVITRAALLERALVEAGLQGIGIEPVYNEVAQLEQDGHLLRLGDEAQDGQAWTTPTIANIEAAMLRAANRPAERQWFKPDAVEFALRAAAHLAEEQQKAVRLAASQDGISIIEAGAGTGKTTAAKAIRDAADRSGLRVVGLSPSWVAANELSRSIGVEAQAIAKWRTDREHGSAPALDDHTLLLVDEAGMVSMRDMAAIVTAAKEAGAKVILLGDSRQLASVPGGSALRAITEVVRQNAVMEAVRRQEVDWQRAASVVMARGDAEAGLRAYTERGHLEMVAGRDTAMQRAMEQWCALRKVHGDDVLIMTRRNADATVLNRLARDVLRSEGRLTGDGVRLPSIDRENKKAELRLAIGDRVRFGETLPDLQIWNGTRGTLEAMQDGETNPILRFRLEDGRTVEQPWGAFARRLPRRAPQPPRMVHAYAGTAYSAQGRTAAASVHYVGAAPDARETYVALTRHRLDVRIVVERDRLDAACRVRQADPRMEPLSADLDEHLFREASQYGEKGNVVDYVADRQTFIATGLVTKPDTRPRRSTARLMQAARALRIAMQDLARIELTVSAWRLVENGRRLLAPLPSALRDAVYRARKNRGSRPEHGLNRDRSPER
ncbi:MobF family relaxase [Lichenihabitans sp. Uapishka_5]|uniref:MobF family relaxase n=1 Tax=Lichenihabitans sp. Uapishka_5 TaxID=3037302 RepID=UPI0029E7FF5B|nr:MobF family relaxase [Lichenihabitans sp. Uapishka_5]MDX7951245.1 MobF family relaxase [Lichenihabitans sp. Uapishka_5]